MGIRNRVEMRGKTRLVIGVTCLTQLLTFSGKGQQNTITGAQQYEKEATLALLREANDIAARLKLPEKLPITENDIVEKFILPAHRARLMNAIGTLTTQEYQYCASKANQFCYLEMINQEDYRRKKRAGPFLAFSKIDTNTAYSIATQWLTAISIDVASLNRDCRLSIIACEPKNADGFIPLYYVSWIKGQTGHGSAAFVELFAPTKTIVQLQVEDSTYNLRRPLQITNSEKAPPIESDKKN